MGKIIGICLAVLCVVLLAACVKDGADPVSSVGVSETVPSSAASASSVPEVSGGDTSLPAPLGTEQQSDPIIAESSNTVSDKEKQAILDELSSELDNALGSIGDLEALDDSDLDVNVID